jgi:deoxyribonuclease V
MSLACLDVDYRGDQAMAACLLFNAWTDAAPAGSRVAHLPAVAPYEPGRFYRRELPCLLAVLEQAGPLEVVVIDGYVWLGPDRGPGLGAHLYEALGRSTAVVGIAKTPFADTSAAEVIRGQSLRPLRVTAAGLDLGEAARSVEKMHGPFRVPTLLKQVDQLCRRSWPPAPV